MSFLKKSDFNIFRNTKMPTSTSDSQISEYDDHSELSGRRNDLYSLSKQFSESGSRRPRVPGWDLEVGPTLHWSVLCHLCYTCQTRVRLPCALWKGTDEALSPYLFHFTSNPHITVSVQKSISIIPLVL